MGFEPARRAAKVEAANEFVDRMKGTLEEAKSALGKAKDEMAQYYNRRRTPAPKFEAGDKVYLDGSDIRTTRPSRKLSHRYLGPFEVVRPVGTHAYRLRLPRSMSRIHPVFHVVKLLPVPDDPIPGRRPKPPPPPVAVGDEAEYEVEDILDSRLRRGKLEFLVSWRGYGYEENSWTPEGDVHAPRLVSKFYREHPNAPRRIRSLEFGRMRFRPVPYLAHRVAAP